VQGGDGGPGDGSPGRRALVLAERLVGAVAVAGEIAAAAVTLVMTALVGYGVVLRYVWNRPQVWTDELVSYLVVLMVMLAAAETLRRGEHITIDLVTERLGRRARRRVDVAGMAAVVAVSGLLVVSGWDMVAFSWTMGVRSTGYLALPEWLPQSAVPLGFALLAAAAANRLLRLLLGLEGPA
jgi:C4-dicarboxylate transporter DctQ subunit